MAGLDLIDCSSASGKPGQVDLRIIARALRTSPTEGVVIISGDSDFAYVLSQLRSARRRTALVYDANNTAAVSTALLEVALFTIGVPFAGEAAGADAPEAAADAEEAFDYLELPATSSAPVSPSGAGPLLEDDPAAQMALLGVPPESTPAAPAAAPPLELSQRHLLEAIARSPEAAPDGGWRMGPSVGEIYRRLSNRDNAAYRAAKKALIQSGRVELDPAGRDLVRLVPA